MNYDRSCTYRRRALYERPQLRAGCFLRISGYYAAGRKNGPAPDVQHGRRREICGAVSGAALVLGVLYGSEDPCNAEEKAAHYARIQEVAEKFRSEAGAIVCRELLKLQEEKSDPTPAARTSAYYHSRPCQLLVETAARAVDEYIAAHPLKGE